MKRFLLGCAALALASAALAQPVGNNGSGNLPVSVVGPANGQCLVFNGTVWSNATCATGGGAMPEIQAGAILCNSSGVLAYPISCTTIPSATTMDVSQVTQSSSTDYLSLNLLPPPTVSYPAATIAPTSTNNNSVIAQNLTSASTVTLNVAGTNGLAAGQLMVITNQNTGLISIVAGAGATINTGAANAGTQYLPEYCTAQALLDSTGVNWNVITTGCFTVYDVSATGVLAFPSYVDFLDGVNFPQNTGTVVVPPGGGIYNNGTAGTIDIGANGVSGIHVTSGQAISLSSLSNTSVVVNNGSGLLASVNYGAAGTYLRSSSAVTAPTFTAPPLIDLTTANLATASTGVTGLGMAIPTATFTDDTIASGSQTGIEAIYAFAQPTLAVGSQSTGTTFATGAATLYVAGCPLLGTNVTAINFCYAGYFNGGFAATNGVEYFNYNTNYAINIGNGSNTQNIGIGGGSNAVIINSNSSGTMNGVTIGGTTKEPGSFTTITNNGATTHSALSTAGIVTNSSAGLLGTTATVPVANGGTNLASYTTGMLLEATGSTTLAGLADVATGSILISQGTSTAPAYSTTIPASMTWPSPGAIGATAPAAGNFTTTKISGPLISAGTAYTVAGTGGCSSPSSHEGGVQAGDFTCSSTAAATATLTLSATTTAYTCWARNITTAANLVVQTGAKSTTSVTLTFTTGTNADIIQFGCIGY
jgi:hypothetical protein